MKLVHRAPPGPLPKRIQVAGCVGRIWLGTLRADAALSRLAFENSGRDFDSKSSS